MTYGIARRYRLEPNEYRYRTIVNSASKVEYVYVQNGFFTLKNMWPDEEMVCVTNGIAAQFITAGVLYYIFAYQMWYHLFFDNFLSMYAAISITAGSHRLWSHRAYEAHWTLRLFMMIGFASIPQGSLLEWTHGHRLHHKFTDTDADPNNPTRGMLFAHVGWTMTSEHPDATRAASKVSDSDLWRDPIVRFHHRYSVFISHGLFGLIMLLDMLVLGDNVIVAFCMCVARINITLHVEGLINSAAHQVGQRPYDASQTAVENVIVTLGTLGEGHHNFHHKFPYDYRTGEGCHFGHDLTTSFIELCAMVGLAWNLRQVSDDIVRSAREKVAQQSAAKNGSCSNRRVQDYGG